MVLHFFTVMVLHDHLHGILRSKLATAAAGNRLIYVRLIYHHGRHRRNCHHGLPHFSYFPRALAGDACQKSQARVLVSVGIQTIVYDFLRISIQELPGVVNVCCRRLQKGLASMVLSAAFGITSRRCVCVCVCV